MKQNDSPTGLEFPCRYPVKAMTPVREYALEQVISVIVRHTRAFDRDSVRVRPSRNGRFQSITVEIEAESRSQLEALYADLRGLDIVVMTL